jgi:hypothetical protein
VAVNRPWQTLPSVQAAESVALLRSLVGPKDRNPDVGDGAISALAFHAGDDATTALIDIADTESVRSTQDGALFWLGQTRAERGARKLEAVIGDDISISKRKHAIFSLSQSKVSLSQSPGKPTPALSSTWSLRSVRPAMALTRP